MSWLRVISGHSRSLLSFRIRLIFFWLGYLVALASTSGRTNALQTVFLFGGAYGFLLSPIFGAWAFSTALFGRMRWWFMIPCIGLIGVAQFDGNEIAIIASLAGLMAFFGRIISIGAIGIVCLSLANGGHGIGLVLALSGFTPASPVGEIMWVSFLALAPWIAGFLSSHIADA